MENFFITLDWLTNGNGEIAMIVIFVLLLIAVIGTVVNEGY
ncbi:hypothetical protein [Enterococcus termitis]|nr:hypothetical protein [Enterococcus termitis]